MNNLAARVISGVIFVPFFIWLIRTGEYLFLGFVIALVGVGLVEFYGFTEAKGAKPNRILGLFCATMLCLGAFFRIDDIFSLILTAFIFIIPAEKVFRQESNNALFDIGATLTGVLFVGWLGSYLIRLREFTPAIGYSYQVGADAVLLCVLVTWACDTFAYFTGKYMGRHPLNKISPKKTWEGAIGGLVFAVLAALATQFWGFSSLNAHLTWWNLVIIGLIGGIFGPVGDLTESIFKRDANIKESATFIPGHGGVLDRFDSMLFTTPFIFYYLKFFVFPFVD
ncbi:MAG: hypothetical protein D6675_04205 [Gemmatimonadetes bacterium]|nr:MAG: hypothetical protein D6675_04205 [Gemmatimonadota bacterium]